MLLLTSVALLAGCSTSPRASSCQLIALKEYPDAFKASLARELSQLEDDSATIQFTADSIRLRDSVRACKGDTAK